MIAEALTSTIQNFEKPEAAVTAEMLQCLADITVAFAEGQALTALELFSHEQIFTEQSGSAATPVWLSITYGGVIQSENLAARTTVSLNPDAAGEKSITVADAVARKVIILLLEHLAAGKNLWRATEVLGFLNRTYDIAGYSLAARTRAQEKKFVTADVEASKQMTECLIGVIAQARAQNLEFHFRIVDEKRAKVSIVGLGLDTVAALKTQYGGKTVTNCRLTRADFESVKQALGALLQQVLQTELRASSLSSNDFLRFKTLPQFSDVSASLSWQTRDNRHPEPFLSISFRDARTVQHS